MSKLRTDLAVDDPVLLTGKYQMGVADRRKIDEQIRDLQQAAVSTILGGSVCSFFRLISGASVPIAAGCVFCLAPDAPVGSFVTPATIDALAVSATPLGIALERAPAGSLLLGLVQGIVPPARFNLGAGAATAIGVDTSTGMLVRIPSPTESDIVLGSCDASGTCVIAGTGTGGGGGGLIVGGSPITTYVVKWNGSAATWQPDTGVTAHSALSGLSSDDHTLYIRTDGTRALTGDISAGSHKITNIAAPTAGSSNAATAAYAEGVAIAAAAAVAVAPDGTTLQGTSTLSVKPGGLSDTHLAVAAGVTLSKLGQSAAATGQAPVWNGTAWVPGSNFGAQNLITTGFVSIGATPSTTGAVRVAHGHSLKGRNSLSLADVNVLDWGATTVDQVRVGDSTVQTIINGSALGLAVAGTSKVTLLAGVAQFQVPIVFAVAAPTVKPIDDATSTSGTGQSMGLIGQSMSAAATGTTTGGAGFVQGGSCSGSGGTRVGGDAYIRPGIGTSSNGESHIDDSAGNKHFRANSTGWACSGLAPIANPARVGQLTDSSGGTPSGTIPAITASYVQADVANAIASLAAKVNALELIIHNRGISQ